MKQAGNTKTVDSRWSRLYKISGAAALIAGVLLLIGMISLITAVLEPGNVNGWLSLFQSNWLVVLFKLNAEFKGVQIDLLHVVNFLDLAVLALVAAMFLGLYAALRKTSRIWSIIAAIQPFLVLLCQIDQE